MMALYITLLAILGATFVNNSSIGNLNHSLDDLKEALRGELDSQFAKLELTLELRFNSIDSKLDELLRVVAGHDHRIREIEDR